MRNQQLLQSVTSEGEEKNTKKKIVKKNKNKTFDPLTCGADLMRCCALDSLQRPQQEGGGRRGEWLRAATPIAANYAQSAARGARATLVRTMGAVEKAARAK